MITSRGKAQYKALVLTARDAARRFAPGRLNHSGRRNRWRPIVLRWRQQVIRPVIAAARGAASPATFLSFSQFHFHLATYYGDRGGSVRLAGSRPSAVIQQERVIVNPNWISAGDSTRVLQAWRAHRPMRSVDSRKNSWSQVHARAPAAPSMSWLKTVLPIATWAAHRPRLLLAGRRSEAARTGTRMEDRTQHFPHRLRVLQQCLQVFAARALTPGQSNPDRSPASNQLPLRLVFPEQLTRGSAQQSPMVMANNGSHAKRRESFQEPQHSIECRRLGVQLERVEELVWRRGPRPPTVAEGRGHEPVRPMSHHGPAALSISSSEAAQAVSPAAVRAAALQATKLDPGLLDRLTDDVIRRVEQRIRIERQRRGL